MSESSNNNPSATAREDLWPMGAVSRRTGITEHTLRAWERRFGFPTPLRLPSGHRRYTSEQVRHLLAINRALQCGYRAGDVVPLALDAIERLVQECSRSAETVESAVDSSGWVEEVLVAAVAFDEASVQSRLRSDAATLGVSSFLRDRAVPLIDEIGLAWERGDLGIRHEHFVSGILEEFLRELRRPLEVSATGRPVVLACLPDELHGLGLELVAAEIAVGGRKTIVLGPQTPVDEIAATASTTDAAAVGLSVSVFAPTEPVTKQITLLREALPSSSALWVGGGGAAAVQSIPEGVQRFDTLDDIAEAVSRL